MRTSVIHCVLACALLPALAGVAAAQTNPSKEFAVILGLHSDPDSAHKVGAVLGGVYPITPNNALGLMADIQVLQPAAVAAGGNRLKVSPRFEYVRKTPWTVGGWQAYVLLDAGGTIQAKDPLAILTAAKALIVSGGTNAGYQGAVGAAFERHAWRSIYLAPSVRYLTGSLPTDKSTVVGGLNFEFKGRVESR